MNDSQYTSRGRQAAQPRTGTDMVKSTHLGRWQRCLLGVAALALLGALLACSQSGQTDSGVSQRATGLAQTAAALLTSTAAASITPETATPLPSATPATTATDTPLPPTDTPAPTETTQACATLKADFVADVNVPDGTHEAAGKAFQKTWRLRNSSDCAWTTDYTLRNVSGEVMGGQTINLPNGVPPGATVDLTVSFVAPSNPGTHKSSWQLFTPDGVAFGTKPYVQIVVP